MIPRKVVALCHVCAFPCKSTITLLEKDPDGKPTSELVFCCRECLMEHFENELFHDKLEAAVKKEFATIHKQVCPACVRRLSKLV